MNLKQLKKTYKPCVIPEYKIERERILRQRRAKEKYVHTFIKNYYRGRSICLLNFNVHIMALSFTGRNRIHVEVEQAVVRKNADRYMPIYDNKKVLLNDLKRYFENYYGIKHVHIS
jgi:hypothetical protein